MLVWKWLTRNLALSLVRRYNNCIPCLRGGWFAHKLTPLSQCNNSIPGRSDRACAAPSATGGPSEVQPREGHEDIRPNHYSQRHTFRLVSIPSHHHASGRTNRKMSQTMHSTRSTPLRPSVRCPPNLAPRALFSNGTAPRPTRGHRQRGISCVGMVTYTTDTPFCLPPPLFKVHQ